MKTTPKPITSGIRQIPTVAAVATFLALSGLAIGARASSIQWQGGTADYTNAPDWAGGVIPGPADYAVNDHGSNNVVEIEVGDPGWTVTSLLAGTGAGDGAFQQNGQTVSVMTSGRAFRLGVASGSTGIYTLNGGVVFYTNGEFNVGEIGTGILNINGGSIAGSGNFAVNLGVSGTTVTASMDGGTSLSGTTWFAQGFDSANPTFGLPDAGSTISSNVLGADHAYTFAPNYAINDAVLIDSFDTSATITLTASTACSALSFLGSAGNGPMSVNYTVHHANATVETGSLTLLDWFNTAGTIAFGAGGRVNADGSGLTEYGAGSFPFLFATDITLSDATSPVTSIDLAYTSGNGEACVMAVSGSTGGDFAPLAITGYNQSMIVVPGAVTTVSPSVTDMVNQAGGAILITNGGQFFVGNYGSAIYNLSGGSIDVYSYIAIGRSGGTGTFNMSGGVMNQDSGGENLLVGTGFNATGGASSAGVLNQSGGIITSEGQFLCPEESPSTGTYNLSGTGALFVTNWIAIGRQGGNGTVNMNGGSITKLGDNTTHLAIGGSSIGILNQTNGTITNLVSDTYLGNSGTGTWNLYGGSAALGLLQIGATTAGGGTLNLNGGVLQASGIACFNTVSVAMVNFNGGTLQANSSNPNFMTGLFSALIESGGAIIDTQGYSITVPQELDGSGGTLTKYGTGTLTLSGPNTYNGLTAAAAGTLVVGTSASGGGAYTVADNGGFGVLVQSGNAQLNVASLSLSGSTMGTLSFNLGSFGNPASAALNVAGTLSMSGNFTVSVADALPQLGQFPLIKYAALTGSPTFHVGTLPTGVTATIVNNTANNSIDLNITGVNQPRWDGEAGGTWDIGLTENWVNMGTGSPTYYTDGSPVQFDDNAAGTTTVSLTAAVTPAKITITNNNLNYTFVGSGSMKGSSGLAKQGTGALAILNTGGNSYTGPTVISGGTLSITNLANGGSPSAIGASSASPTNLVISGATFSYGGSPVIINRGFLATNATIDTEGSLTLGGLGQNSSNMTKIGPATLTYAGVGTNILATSGAVGAFQANNGTLVFDGSAGSQSNSVTGELWVGSTTSNAASLVLTNTTLGISSWLSVGRGNGTNNFVSSVSLYNSLLTCGQISLGYSNGLPNAASPTLTLHGNSKVTVSSTDINLGESTGSSATINVLDSSAITSASQILIGGPSAKGVLNLNATGTSMLATNAGPFRIGGNNPTDVNLIGVGAVNQSAGTLISGVTSGIYMALGIGGTGNNVYGSYNLSGGTLTQPGVSGIRVGYGGQASFVQSGGTLNCGREFSLGGNLAVANAVATFTGGSATINPSYTFLVPEAGSTAALNIGTEAGGNASVVTLSTSGVTMNNSSGGNGTLNLNSGTLQLGGHIFKNNSTGTAIVNLNGGTLQAGLAAVTLIDSSPNSVNVYKGGVVVDSMANTAAIAAKLLTTAGNGVYPSGGILAVTNNGGAGYIGAPLVAVTTSGAGSGLKAVATVSNGVVTNVAITCPGQNYSAGDTVSFAFSGGGSTTAASTFIYTLRAADLAANGTGGLTKIGSGTLYLNGANTYTGSTVVNAGTLAGSGSIASPVSVSSGATIAAGTSSIGTLTINNTLTFGAGSTAFMRLAASSNDQVIGLTGVTYGGALVVTNTTGTSLAAGTVFKLFTSSAAGSGNFSSVSILPSGSASFNPATGQLTITALAPSFKPITVSGGKLILTASGGTPGAGYTLLTATNVTTPLSAWMTNMMGTLDGTGAFSNGIPVNTGEPERFFRVRVP
jgi:autotransporter-associated beta strand protein